MVGNRDMNRLRRDVRRHRIAMVVTSACAVGLGLYKLVQLSTGLEEQEFYRQYPASWWIVVTMGSGFIIGLAYSVRKSLDIDPNVQLRSQADEALMDVLADPDYKPWHPEAQNLLAERHSLSHSRRRWGVELLSVLVVVFLVFLRVVARGIHEDLRPKNGGLADMLGLFLYMTAGLFIFMSSLDRIKRIRLRRHSIPLSIAVYSCFCLWLVGSMLWVIQIFDL